MTSFPFSLLLLLSSLALAADQVLAKNPLECDPSSFGHPVISGAEILSLSVEQKRNVVTLSSEGFILSKDSGICDVKIHLTHPGTHDDVLVEVWLPLAHDDWNGRFLATGGGGYSSGGYDMFLGPAVRDGYAAATTNAGTPSVSDDISWGIDPAGDVNWGLLQNMAYRSLADMIRVGKSITEQWFGTAPHHSYWSGCSQGGRQGYMVAQRYPELLDGILAAAPAIDWNGLGLGMQWPQVVMRNEGIWMSNCELDWFSQKAIEECDMLDGVRDGVIEDPEECGFDPQSLVGRDLHCEGKNTEITKSMATVIRKIKEGPTTPFGAQLWHGFPYGAPTTSLANTTVSEDGVRSGISNHLSSSWIKNMLLKQKSFNVSELTYSEYLALWVQSHHEYGWLLDTTDANLIPFRDAGGKLLTWHGINDPLISYNNTIQYRKHVEQMMGGAKAVDDFYRVFLAPGVEHCGFGAGAAPKDPLDQLVDWVEKKEAPQRLDAETVTKDGELMTRALCLWPRKARYMGISDANRASSWTCEGGYEFGEDEETLEDQGDFLDGLKNRLLGLDMGLKIGS
jgi:hypothetical protein